MKWLMALWEFFFPLPKVAAPVPVVTLPTIQSPTMTNQENLYREAKVCLGYPQKLDSSVPNLVACASSLSGVLVKAGFVGLPQHGIGGTEAMNMFLKGNAAFEAVSEGAAGDIIISPSNSPGAVLQHGHCGVVGNNGIMSNDSDTGLWREAWTLPRWNDYYGTYGKLPVLFYRWTGDKAI